MDIVWRDTADPAVYEAARTRRLFNALLPQRHPVAIVSVKCESDIIDAVRLAAQKQHRVSVRAGGHSFPAWSVRDRAILVDLGAYSEIKLDETTGHVCVSPATTGRELVRYLSSRDLTVSVGHCPDVGLGGFLLGGGMGWNCNNLGWACEQVVAVDVVTASGDLVRADAQENSDLFWAARGSGPAFPGVVSRFHLRTMPAPEKMRSSVYVYPASHYRTVLGWILNVVAEITGNIETTAFSSYQPETHRLCITIRLNAFGDAEDTLQGLQQAEDSRPEGTISHQFSQETTLENELNNMGKAFPSGHRYCVDNAFLKDDSDIVSILEQAFATLPSEKSLALWNSMIPCSKRDLPDMALSMQSSHYFELYAIWEEESDDSRCQTWVRDTMLNVSDHAVGSYLGEFDFQSRPSTFWGGEQYQKLKDVRRKWDPDGRFCGCLGLEMDLDDL